MFFPTISNGKEMLHHHLSLEIVVTALSIRNGANTQIASFIEKWLKKQICAFYVSSKQCLALKGVQLK